MTDEKIDIDTLLSCAEATEDYEPPSMAHLTLLLELFDGIVAEGNGMHSTTLPVVALREIVKLAIIGRGSREAVPSLVVKAFDAEELMECLPVVAEMSPEVRERVLLGMNDISRQLAEPLPEDAASSMIGVLIIDDAGFDARIITRAQCLKSAEHVGMTPDELSAIQEPARDGEFDILLLAGPVHLVFGLPVTAIDVRLPPPHSENN
jgi:hypothetical protein